MSKITIIEEDFTKSLGNNLATSTDVVFIPGFMGESDTGKQLLGKLGQPTLCKTLNEFQLLFGTKPAQFKAGQLYPRLDVTDIDNDSEGFLSEAIPRRSEGDVLMFNTNDPDPSFVMACELLKAGLPVLYYAIQPTADENMVTAMYKSIADILDAASEGHSGSILLDNEQEFKYLTTGGYPTFEYSVRLANQPINYNFLAEAMASVAKARGDVIAIIDHTNNPERNLGIGQSGQLSIYDSVNGACKLREEGIDSYAAMFTPWAEYKLTKSYPAIGNHSYFGGSFAYLLCLAKSLEYNPNWYAIAGASRGLVSAMIEPNLAKKLTNAIANSYQEEVVGNACINPITNIKPYGQCIWGNRTLREFDPEKEGYAASFINLRGLLCDVKKQAHMAAQSLMFEQNNDVLWINFKSMVTPLLDRMLSGNGISAYKIVKIDTASKTKLSAQIKIYPIYAVEEFNIGIQITDEDVTVE